MHGHQLLSNLINPALPAPLFVGAHVCVCPCLFTVSAGAAEGVWGGGVKWIRMKREGRRDGRDGGGRRRGAGEEMERERANRKTGVWVINAPLRLC